MRLITIKIIERKMIQDFKMEVIENATRESKIFNKYDKRYGYKR